jgi:hypothetical protein
MSEHDNGGVAAVLVASLPPQPVTIEASRKTGTVAGSKRSFIVVSRVVSALLMRHLLNLLNYYLDSNQEKRVSSSQCRFAIQLGWSSLND